MTHLKFALRETYFSYSSPQCNLWPNHRGNPHPTVQCRSHEHSSVQTEAQSAHPVEILVGLPRYGLLEDRGRRPDDGVGDHPPDDGVSPRKGGKSRKHRHCRYFLNFTRQAHTTTFIRSLKVRGGSMINLVAPVTHVWRWSGNRRQIFVNLERRQECDWIRHRTCAALLSDYWLTIGSRKYAMSRLMT